MTVSTTATRVAYAGDGVTTAFPVVFPFFDPQDLEVIERIVLTGAETLKSLAADYNVSGGNGSTGSVVATVAPAAMLQWIIRRRTPLTQLIDYTSNDSFPAESHEKGLDRGAMRDQEAAEELSRAIRLPKTDSASLSTTLPSSVDRANRYLKFDASGNPIVAEDVAIGTLSLPVAIADGGTGASSAAGARTALAAAGVADNNILTGNNRFQGGFSVESADAGASEAPVANLDRLSASPVANDAIGALSFRGKDAGGATLDYAKVSAQIIDPTDASEDGRLLLQTVIGGTLGSRAYVGDGLVVGSPAGADKGGGTVNATALYQNGGAVQLKVSYAKLMQSVASGTNGGSSVATTWTKLPLNSEYDPDGFVTFSDANDNFSLPAGTFRFAAYATVANAGSTVSTQMRLRNTTDGSTALLSTGASSMFAGAENKFICLSGEIVIAATKTFELQYWSSGAQANTGLGAPVSSGENEIYRVIEIWRVA